MNRVEVESHAVKFRALAQGARDAGFEKDAAVHELTVKLAEFWLAQYEAKTWSAG